MCVCIHSSCLFSQYTSLISHPSGLLPFYETSLFMLILKQIIRAYLSSEVKLVYYTTMMSECSTLIFLNSLAKFNKTCYKIYDIIDHIKVKIYGFLKSVLATTRTRELVKWEATNLNSCVLFAIWATSSGKTQC